MISAMPTEEEIRRAYDGGVEAVIALFKTTFTDLSARLLVLEGRLNQHSQNSHKPPSSDGYRKPAPKSLRKKSGRRSGGQTGHAGTTLEMRADPDRVDAHWPNHCGACGQSLETGNAAGYEIRQVHDVPAIQMEVTEHRAMQVVCPCCGAKTQAGFPTGVKPGAQYGSGVAALAVYAQVYQLLPLERSCEWMRDVIQCRLSEGTLVNRLADCATRVEPIAAQIKAALLRAAVGHFDETGVRVAGILNWLHTASTSLLTHYTIDPQRGRAAQDRIGILPGFEGVAIHDALPSYLRYRCAHGLCNAHLLRELTALEDDPSHRQRWPTRLKALLIEMKSAVDHALAQGQTQLCPQHQHRFVADYTRLVTSALRVNPRPRYQPGQRGRPRASPARNLAERLRDHQPSVLRFLHDFRVPFDNNLAERDLRMMKVKQKISGCFRSHTGARHFALVRGYLSTVRKHGYGALQALRALFDGAPLALQLA